MTITKAVTVRLDAIDYDRLTAEAERLGTSVGALAREFVRAGLAESGMTDAERRRRAGLAALDKLASLRARLPDVGPIDVVELIQEGRRELDRRTQL